MTAHSPHDALLLAVSQSLGAQLVLLQEVIVGFADKGSSLKVEEATVHQLQEAISRYRADVHVTPVPPVKPAYDVAPQEVNIDTGEPAEPRGNGAAKGPHQNGAKPPLHRTNSYVGEAPSGAPLRQVWATQARADIAEASSASSAWDDIATAPVRMPTPPSTVPHRRSVWGEWLRYVLSPTTLPRQAWTFLLVGVIAFDLVTMPLAAFGYRDDGTRFYIACFLTFDLFFSFFMGFDVRGRIELRISKIVAHYLKTWFLLDLTIIMLDWMDLFGGPDSVTGAGWMLRVLRLLRIARVIRIVRIAQSIDAWTDHIVSGALITLITIAKLLAFLLLFCHCIGCCWYYIGTTDGLRGDHAWVDEFPKLLGDGDDDLSIFYRYVISLRWTVCQFTPSASPFRPQNLLEEMFNVALIFGGLVIFSSFVGSVTTTLTAMRVRAEERTRQNVLFKRYVDDNHISPALARRISHFAKEHHRHSVRTIEKDISFTKSLPESLLLEMRAQVFAPVLCQHPFFGFAVRRHRSTMLLTCHRTCGHELLMTGDELLSYNNEAKKMVFVIAGRFEYYDGAMGTLESPAAFEERQWLNEASLFLKYQHRGRTIARMDSDCVGVDAGLFAETVISRRTSCADMRRYAVAYYELAQHETGPLEIWSAKEAAEQLTNDVFGENSEVAIDHIGSTGGHSSRDEPPTWTVKREECLSYVDLDVNPAPDI